MNEKQLRILKEEEYDFARIGIIDTDGVLRGKMISKEKLLSILEKGFGFCNVVFAWDINDRLYDAIEDSGYPDETATLDLNTLRFLPQQNNRPFLLADFSKNDRNLSRFCPRTLLKKVNEKAKAQGYTALLGAEFEWFNFAETPQSLAAKNSNNPQPLTPGMFGYSLHRQALFQNYTDDILKRSKTMRIPIEGIHTETGDGVYEAAITYAPAVEAADRAALFKSLVKEVANEHGIIASFMAKWNAALPGCSGHVHQSLWDIDKNKNLFSDKGEITKLAESYIAGQLHCLPYILPMYAPTINSYKRFVKGSWASVSVSWGIENRTTALRFIPNKSDKSSRLETRVPGSDANPYLSMSAALASGLYGIEQQLKLDIPPTKGNEYLNTLSQKLPTNLLEASQAMAQSEIAETLFGKAFVKYFTMTRLSEWQLYNQAVTDWELKRYFEIV